MHRIYNMKSKGSASPLSLSASYRIGLDPVGPPLFPPASRAFVEVGSVWDQSGGADKNVSTPNPSVSLILLFPDSVSVSSGLAVSDKKNPRKHKKQRAL